MIDRHQIDRRWAALAAVPLVVLVAWIALRVLMKLAGGSLRFGPQLSLDRFMEQALRARRAGEEDVMSRVFTLLQTAWRSHPFPLWRAAELWRWACQGEYINLLQSVATQINGKTLCAFGDAAATPVLTTLKLFRNEFEVYAKGERPAPADYRASQPAGAHH